MQTKPAGKFHELRLQKGETRFVTTKISLLTKRLSALVRPGGIVSVYRFRDYFIERVAHHLGPNVQYGIEIYLFRRRRRRSLRCRLW